MPKATNILVAERELDWYFNDAVTALSLRAIDPGALIVDVSRTDYTDHQMQVVERAKPIMRALRRCSQRVQMVLALAFTHRVWRAAKDHHNESPHWDYETVYGARLAGIVRHYRLKGTVDERRARADAMLTGAILVFTISQCRLD